MSIDLGTRTLDDWYRATNSIFLDRNFDRDPMAIFAHLVEVLGGLSLLASDKSKPRVEPERFVSKALAWWMALCGRVGVRSVEEMIWLKFPAVCSYCHLRPHRNDRCSEIKREVGLDWVQLAELGRDNVGQKPATFPGWLGMFIDIYPLSGTEQYPATFARFSEELGELDSFRQANRVGPLPEKATE